MSGSVYTNAARCVTARDTPLGLSDPAPAARGDARFLGCPLLPLAIPDPSPL